MIGLLCFDRNQIWFYLAGVASEGGLGKDGARSSEAALDTVGYAGAVEGGSGEVKAWKMGEGLFDLGDALRMA
jgi:hypothetical protein